MNTKMTPEQADAELTRRLRREAELEWMRRYTIEQCAIKAEEAAMYNDLDGANVTKKEMVARAMATANRIRALRNKPLATSTLQAMRATVMGGPAWRWWAQEALNRLEEGK